MVAPSQIPERAAQCRGGRPAWAERALSGLTSRAVSVGGHRLHLLDEGPLDAAPPLVLLHGNPTWCFLYRGVIARLRPWLRCIAPDLPGFGLSEAPEPAPLRPAEQARVLAGLLDRLGIERFRLLVHDWGGPIGLAVAAQRPQAVAGLVITNTWAWPLGCTPRLVAFSRVFGGAPGRLLVERWNAFVELGLRVGTCRRPLRPAVLEGYRGPFREVRRRVAMRRLAAELLDSGDFLAGLERSLATLADVPALILWGARDPAFRGRERRRFERLFPNHRRHILEGAGHFVPEDAAPEIAAAITAWRASLEGRDRVVSAPRDAGVAGRSAGP